MKNCEQQVAWMEERVRGCGRGAGRLATRMRRRATAPRRKVTVEKSATDAAPFAFQKRVECIDWRSLHSVDVDRLIRHADIDALEAILDTIAFGDIQGEDTRNFTQANFIKIFRLAQLMVEYLLHVQDLLAHHKSELLESRSSLQQRNEKLRSRFMWQRDALLHTRHELKQAKQALQTYEVMLKIQGKHQAIQASCQSDQRQGRHCSFCEKVFESPYYLDLHVARKHQQKQGATEDKLLAMVSAAKVKEEMNFAVQTEIQLLRKRYQADLRRTETSSNSQIRTLQEDLRRSDNRLHDVQTQIEVLQAQILSNNARVGRFHAVEKSKGKDHDGLYQEVDDLQKENQHLRRAITKVHNTSNLEADNQSPENPANMDPVRILTSRLRSPKLSQPQAPRIKSSATSSFQIHKIPEPSLAIFEAKEPAIHDTTTDFHGLVDEELLPVASTPRERWTMEPDKDEALLALARRSSRMEERSVTIEECKSRGDESPITAEEMRTKLETEMKAAQAEQKRRQKAVQRRLAKELVKEKSETKSTRNSKPGSQHSQTPKSETPHEGIAPLLLLLRNKEDASSPSSSTIHAVRKIVSYRVETKQPTCDLRPLNPAVHPPKTSLHMAVLNSDPNSKRTQSQPQTNKSSKEHIIERLGAVTRELGKYFPPKTNVVEKVQPVKKPETEATEEDDAAAKRFIAHEHDDQGFQIQDVARDHVGEATSKTPAREEKANEFDEELQKFGITSSTNGISDSTYNSVSSAFKTQRSLRMSQKAINCDRDTAILESQFDVTTESGDSGSESNEISLKISSRNQVVSRDRHLKANGKELLYFSPNSDRQHGSRAFALKQPFRRNRNRPLSRGEVIESSTIAKFVDNSWQPELEKEVKEEDLGLGD